MIYRETGVHELKAEIYRSQYKFWAKIKDEIETDPDTSTAKVYKKAIHDNIHYLRHYKQLHVQFRNHEQCFNHYRDTFLQNNAMAIHTKATLNVFSLYNDYIALNSQLLSPTFYIKYILSESERMLLTKYRTGSHYLHIQSGRAANTT